MESPITSQQLGYTSPAWPARFAGTSIFIATLFIFFFFPNIPFFVPAITFVVMIPSILFSAETTVIADKTSRTLTVSKKRIMGSTDIVYSFDDIVFICQNITTSVNQKGENTENIKYTLGLRSKTGTLPGYYRGYQPILLPIPISIFAMFIQAMGGVQKLTRARELANFIGVQFYVNGGQNDTLINTMEDAPRYFEAIKNIPDALAEAKKENDRVAREILGDKYTN